MKDDLNELIDAVRKYYPSSQSKKNHSVEIAQLITNKLNQIDYVTEWSKIVDELKNAYEVIDLAFLQFPNYKLYLEDIEEIGDSRMFKNFTVCVSLLCPFYTYFFEYDVRPPAEKFESYEGKTVFLSYEKFKLVKREIDIKKVRDLIEANFQGYKYVSHYDVMNYAVSAGAPYGEFGEGEYSIYAYLFEVDVQIKKIYP